MLNVLELLGAMTLFQFSYASRHMERYHSNQIKNSPPHSLHSQLESLLHIPIPVRLPVRLSIRFSNSIRMAICLRSSIRIPIPIALNLLLPRLPINQPRNRPRKPSSERLSRILTRQILHQRNENIRPRPGKNMPPAMQLQQKAPRHPHLPLPPIQLSTNRIVDIPDSKPGYENDTSPGAELEDLGFDERVGDSGGDDGAGFEANSGDHEAEEDGVHGYLVRYTVPGAEGGHGGRNEEAGEYCHGEGGVEGEDAVEHGGCCYEHGEVVTWGLLV